MASPTPRKSKNRLQWAAATVVYVLGGCSAGLILGGVGGSLLSSGVGVDALADVIGGIGVGVLVGAVLTLGSARRLTPLRRARIGSMLFLLSAVVFAALRARAGASDRSEAPGGSADPLRPTQVAPPPPV